MALAAAARQPPDLILLDVDMPGMNGAEVARLARAKRPRLPILFLTGFADRAADVVAEFGGSWKFIIASILFLNFWVVLNSWLLQRNGFDPYPYILLSLVINMVTALQAPIIMMSQNRQAEKDRLRANLDYQLNLKNELLLSDIIRRLDQLDKRLGRE